MKRYYFGSLLLIVIFAGSPMGSMFLASFVANAAGCKLDEDGAHTCMIYGHEYGPRLYDMAVSMWLMIFTFPAAEFAFLVWLGVLSAHLIRLHLQRRRGMRRS